ncbi:AAA family ATPase [Mycobacterium sp. NPDC050853]|uniref:MinD/ParA family ATP-binding protein n=1 Tax=Mycobacterium sp. NPDC050853 TaxID=3155160 RepID=UPI0033F0B5D1
MPKQDRVAPVRPPWLPEEDDHRKGLFRRRRKSESEHEATPVSREKTAATPAPAASSLKADKSNGLAPKRSVEEQTVDASANKLGAANYFVPARSESAEIEPVESARAEPEPESLGPESDSAPPKIVTQSVPLALPTPAPLSEPIDTPPARDSQPVSTPEVLPGVSGPESESLRELDDLSPETATTEAVALESVTPVVGSISQPEAPDPEPVRSSEFVAPAAQALEAPDESIGSDPFSRFSELEAKLRQMGLDESIPEEVRQNALALDSGVDESQLRKFIPPEQLVSMVDPEPAVPEPVSFVRAEKSAAVVVPDVHEPPQSRHAACDEVEIGEPDDGIADSVEPEPEPEPEPALAQLPPVEIPRSSEADDIDARAAALLQRIEAKRAELNRDMAAISEPDAESERVAAEQNSEDFAPVMTAPAPFVPESEPNAEVELAPESVVEVSAVEPEREPQPVEVEPVAAVSEPEPEPIAVAPESVVEVSAVEHDWQPQPVEVEPVAVAQPEPDVSVGEAREPEAIAEAVSELPDESVLVAHVQPEQTVGPEPQQAHVPTEAESPAVTPESVGPQEPSPPEGVKEPGEEARPPRPVGRRLATPPWQIPNAVQQAPAVEPPPGPAYYVPPQQSAAVVPPPGWTQGPEQPQQWPPQQQGPQPPPMAAPPQAPNPYAGQHPAALQVPGHEMPWGHGQPAGPPPQQVNQMPPLGWVPAPMPQQQPPQPGYPMRQEVPPLPPGHVPPPQFNVPPANYQAPQAYRMPPSLDEAAIINRGLHAPRSGWRRAVHRASAGHVNPGDSRKDRDHEDLLARIRQPILGDYRIAVLSIKGGVGKTTTTLGLGSAFATVRTDRIIAVDANPDRGTLAERVRNQSTHSTVRDLLNDDHINSYADVRNHTRMATSRLEVLASEQDPAVSEAYGEVDYRHTIEILQRYYNIILTDCGTGIMHSAMTGVLDLAHTIVLVSSPAMDAARSASATLDWLMQHGHSGLVREAHVVLSASRPGTAGIKLDKVYEHFEARCRSIHLVPFDPHLAEGADVDFNLLGLATNEAYLGLAGAIAENFPRLRTREQQM